jgi:hypothetical protein
MKKLFLAAFLAFFTLSCQAELVEIKEVKKPFQGLWKVTHMSTDQGKTYYEPKEDLSFKINASTIVMGDGTILFINRVLEATERGIYFNIIVFDNNDELFTITRRKDECLIAIFSIDRKEVTRVLVKWEKSEYI